MVSFSSMQPELVQHVSFNTILVVEDDEDSREMLTICIESETSYHVLALASAEEALQRLEEIKEAEPRLFIFDFHLLLQTGLELYDSLHAMKAFEHVPAIIITAATPSLELDRAVTKRKLTLLLKPFDLDDLIDCIEGMLICPGQLI